MLIKKFITFTLLLMIFCTKVSANSAEYLGSISSGNSIFRVILDADTNLRFDLGVDTTNFGNKSWCSYTQND